MRTQTLGFVCIAHRADCYLNNKSSLSAHRSSDGSGFGFCFKNCCLNKRSFTALLRGKTTM